MVSSQFRSLVVFPELSETMWAFAANLLKNIVWDEQSSSLGCQGKIPHRCFTLHEKELLIATSHHLMLLSPFLVQGQLLATKYNALLLLAGMAVGDANAHLYCKMQMPISMSFSHPYAAEWNGVEAGEQLYLMMCTACSPGRASLLQDRGAFVSPVGRRLSHKKHLQIKGQVSLLYKSGQNWYLSLRSCDRLGKLHGAIWGHRNWSLLDLISPC